MITFETKMKKCDLKEEPDLKSRRWFTLFEPVIPGS